MPSSVQTHDFVQEATRLTQPTFSRSLAHVHGRSDRKVAQAENRARMTAAERYETLVLQRTLGLLGTLQYLEDARRLIRVFPSQLSRGRSGITRDRWADYHFGCFTVSLASLPDIGVVLTATVCQLGLHLRHCKPEIVTSHDAIRGTGIATALRGLIKSVAGAKERRNRHVHRGERAEIDDLSPDGFLLDLKTLTFLHSIDPSFIDPRALRMGWREAAREIIPYLDEETQRVEVAFSTLFDALLPQLKWRSKSLRALQGKPNARAT